MKRTQPAATARHHDLGPAASEWTGTLRHPPAVEAALVGFLLMTLFALAANVAIAVADTRGGDYTYLVPVTLYVLLFGVFFLYNRAYYRRTGRGSLGNFVWGFSELPHSQVAFLLVSLALVAWMNAISGRFFAIYLALFGQTLGMLWSRARLRALGFALLAFELAVFAYQTGFAQEVLEGRASVDQLVSVGVGALAALVCGGMLTALIHSRMQSEHLVQELKQTQVRLEKALHREQEVAVLRERDRLAREMHDVLGHALVLVAVKIEAAQRLQAEQPGRATEELEATKRLVRETMAELRASLAGLRGPAFEPGGLPLSRALAAWAQHAAAEAGFAIELNVSSDIDALPAPVQEALLRVAREAVLNVVKHARASHVVLSAFVKDGSARLSVLDDGVGIPHLAEGTARLEVEGHYGVRGMRERVEALGGQLKVSARPQGSGTLVAATVPLPPSEPGARDGAPAGDAAQPSTFTFTVEENT